MIKNFAFVAITIMTLLIGCKKSSSPAPTPAPVASCDATYTATYNIAKDVTQDFIAENITPTVTITTSNCPGLPVGNLTTSQTNWITRADKNLTFSTGSSPITLEDYVINGTSVTLKNVQYCSDYSEQITDSMSAASIVSAGNKITVSGSLHVVENDCTPSSGPIGQEYLHSALKGVWKSACVANTQYWYGFYHNSLAVMKRVYSGACSGNPLFYIEWNGPHTVKDTVSGNIKQFDVSFQNFYVKIYDETTRASMNTSSICGISNWTLNTDTSVLGLNCDFNSIGLTTSEIFPVVSKRVYDIFEISGSILKLGNSGTGDKTSAANRPSSIDSGSNYTLDTSIFIIPTWAQ